MAMTTTAAMEAIARRETPGLAGAATDALWAAGILSCAVALESTGAAGPRLRAQGPARPQGGRLPQRQLARLRPPHARPRDAPAPRAWPGRASPWPPCDGAAPPRARGGGRRAPPPRKKGRSRHWLLDTCPRLPGPSRAPFILAAFSSSGRAREEPVPQGLPAKRPAWACSSPAARARSPGGSWGLGALMERGIARGAEPWAQRNGTGRERLLKRLGRGNGLAGGGSRRGIGTHRRTALLAEARLVRDFCPTVVFQRPSLPRASCSPSYLKNPGGRSSAGGTDGTAWSFFINIYQPKLHDAKRGAKPKLRAPRGPAYM